MSASSKKKLRKEIAAAALTEKQRKEQAEAKKLKAISVAFVAIMLVVALTAVSVLGVRAVNNSGVIDRNTIAAVAGEHELNSVQLSYYYKDIINNQYSQWQSAYSTNLATYLKMMGLDINKPLNKQVYDPESGETWADHFLSEALEKAKSDYALYDKATAEGFKLSEDEQKAFDSGVSNLELYAMYYGYKNADKFLVGTYGFGSDVESYTHYNKVATIASAYYNKYSEDLSYDDAAIREYEKDKYNDYTSFDFARYYVSTSDYIKGGTKDEHGHTVYTDAEKEAAIKAAKEVADLLAASKSVVELDKAVAGLAINKDKKDAASTKSTKLMYPQVPTAIQSWLADKDRAENDITVIANETTSKDKDGKEVKEIGGYYVVLFQGRNENLRKLANVRHLLVKFEGGTTGTDGNKTYSDKEKATAKTEAERLLKVWKDGTATEDTFIAMVKAYSDDGSASEGGLFEDIHASSGYVPSFRNWCVDENRKTGDVEIIESEYGYHIMYYVGDGELTYRDYMISEDLRAKDVEDWYKKICDGLTVSKGNTKRIDTDMILAASF